MKKTISSEQWQFPQGDPRVVVGAKVARIARGQVVAIGAISKLTPTQLRFDYIEGTRSSPFHRATGYPVDRAVTGCIRLATDEDLAAFEQYKAEQQRRQAEIAERAAMAARSAEANLRRYVALIRAATSDEAAMAHLQQFADRAGWYGLAAEWPESESTNGA